MSAVFTIVAPCKGRRRYLEQALPTFLAQANAEVLVVDYDCPDETAEWLRASHPRVHVVKVEDAPIFNLSRARNAGVAAVATPWVVVCDADQLLDPSFTTHIAPALRPSVYLRSYFETDSGAGVIQLPLVCETAVYRAVGGYDDALEGWGAEDLELGQRLSQHGVAAGYFPIALVHTMAHSDDERTRYYDFADKAVSRAVNLYYMRIKERYFDSLRRAFTDAQRFDTYRQIKEAVLAAIADPTLDRTFDIVVQAATPPWTARIRASEARALWRSASAFTGAPS